MDQAVVTALIGAGAAVAGGAVTGWFTLGAAKRQADAAWAAGARQADAAWAAGRSQADAAWAAGLRQADAQLDVARRTLEEQARAVQRDVRRAAYVVFLGRIETAYQALLSYQGALGGPAPQAAGFRQAYETAAEAVHEPLNIVRLEGPAPVVAAAESLEAIVRRTAPVQGYAAARAALLTEAQAALAA